MRLEKEKLGLTKGGEVNLGPHVSFSEIEVLDQSFSLFFGNIFAITEVKLKILTFLTTKKELPQSHKIKDAWLKTNFLVF